jgi:TrmH family RNA methyltransferase
VKLIKSKENPLIKEIKKIIDEKEERRVFLLEGKKLVEEALFSNVEILYILVTERFFKEKNDFIKKIEDYEIIVIDERIERSLSTVETPQGILALAYPGKRRKFTLEGDSIFLFLYKIKDPGNLGTIFRSAEAFGVEGIYLSPDSCSPFNTKVIRASAGSCLRINFFENVEFERVKKEIKEKKGKIYSTSPRGGIPPWEEKWEGITCLVIGSEPEGIPKEIISLSDSVVSIPQIKGESLNVAISTSIILYEIYKNRSLR